MWCFFPYQSEREVLYFDFFTSKMLWKSAASCATFWWKWKPRLLTKHHSSAGSSDWMQVTGLIPKPVSSQQKSLELTRASRGLQKVPSARRYLPESSWARKGLCSSLIYSPWIIQPLLVIALPHVSVISRVWFYHRNLEIGDGKGITWVPSPWPEIFPVLCRCGDGNEPGPTGSGTAAQGLRLQYIPCNQKAIMGCGEL